MTFRNRVLYSQNRYESYDLDIEYTDSIKMEKSDLSFDDEDTDEFEKSKGGGECSQTPLLLIGFYNTKMN